MSKDKKSLTSKENSILNWEIEINLENIDSSKKNKYNYLKNIFDKPIRFWNFKKINENNLENYFSIIIWKNWVWKSSFIEYLINYFNHLDNNKKEANLMYITFSIFDTISNISDEYFIYNWPKNKAHATIKRVISNNNKLKILNFIINSKTYIKDVIELIKYIYWYLDTDIDLFFQLAPKFNTKVTALKKNENFSSYLKNLEKELINNVKWTKIKFNNLDLVNLITLYIFIFFYQDLKKSKEIDFMKLNKKFDEVIKKLSIDEKIRSIDISNFEKKEINRLNDFQENYKKFSFFLDYLNSIRDLQSMEQPVDIHFYIKKDLNSSNSIKVSLTEVKEDSYKNLLDWSSWELNFLYTILHLSDLLNVTDKNFDQKKKIIIIDEPEISLHPQWQRDYIEKLNKWLEILKLKNCFFIIVTHSPLIVLSSQEKKVKNADEFDNKYNVNVYVFKKDDDWKKTISEEIKYISMNSIDEILWDDFWVKIISRNQELNINERYFNLLKKIKSENSKKK